MAPDVVHSQLRNIYGYGHPDLKKNVVCIKNGMLTNVKVLNLLKLLQFCNTKIILFKKFVHFGPLKRFCACAIQS